MSSEKVGPRQRGAATKRKRTQAKILTAAHLLFNMNGWYGVTVEEVAKEARIGAATVTLHYPTKQELVIATYESEVTAVINAHAADASSFIHALVAVLTKHSALTAALTLPPRGSISPAVSSMINRISAALGDLLRIDPPAREISALDKARYHLLSLLMLVVHQQGKSDKDVAWLVLSQLQ